MADEKKPGPGSEPAPPTEVPDVLSPAEERRKTAQQRDGEKRGDVITENISNP
jgi:hypothetical protein